MASYYVATTGDDANNGAIGTPFQTIGKAADVASSGDDVYVRAGFYNEKVSLLRSGSSGNEITFQNYPSETVWVDGEYDLPAGSSREVTSVLGQPIEDYNYSPLVRISADYVIWDGIGVQYSKGRGFQIEAGSNNIVRNCTIRHCRTNGVQNHYDSDSNTYDTVIVYDCGTMGSFGRPSRPVDHPVIFNDSKATSTTITGCQVYESFGEGINVGSGGTIEDCKIWDNVWITGIYIGHEENVTIQRNLIYHTGRAEFIRETGVIKGGIVLNNEKAGDNPGPNDNFDISNNILINCAFDVWGSQGSGVGHQNIDVFNNTFVRTATGSQYQDAPISLNSNASFDAIVVKNNLIYWPSATTMVDASSESGFTWDYNCWSKAPPAWVVGANDIVGNPSIYKPNAPVVSGGVQANNYKLNDDSICIDAGTSTGAPTDDFFGSTRSGSWDIGAHEYGGASTPTGAITAAFSAVGATTGTGALSVSFNNTSTSDSGITSYLWYIKEDSESAWPTYSQGSSADFMWTFAPGTWSVRLEISGPDGSDSATKNSLVYVAEESADGGSASASTASGGVVATAMSPSGSQSLSISGPTWRPTATLLLAGNCTAADTPADGLQLGFGASDGSAEWVAGTSGEDDVGTSNTSRHTRTSAAITVPLEDSYNNDAAASVESFGLAGVDLNWTNGPSDYYQFATMMIAADAAAVGTFDPSDSVDGTVVVSGLGFEPDLIIVSQNGTAADNTGSDARWSIGVSVNGGDEGCVAWYYDDAYANGRATMHASDSHCAASISNSSGSIGRGLDVTTFGSDGFTVTTRVGSSSQVCQYLALSMPTKSFHVGFIDTPTSTGEQAYTGFGFRPDMAMFIGTMAEAVNTAYADAHAGAGSVGMWSGLTEAQYSWCYEAGADPTVASMQYSDKIVNMRQDDESAGITATVSSADADGITLNYTATLAAARKLLVLAFESEASTTRKDWLTTGIGIGGVVGLP